jgi:hypothetical protein
MPISPTNNCSDQVIDMAQVQQIYARLFAYIDVATSLLLKQDLVDAEFVREQNQRIFIKLNAIQDAALMRSSSQEAELQLDQPLFACATTGSDLPRPPSWKSSTGISMVKVSREKVDNMPVTPGL